MAGWKIHENTLHMVKWESRRTSWGRYVWLRMSLASVFPSSGARWTLREDSGISGYFCQSVSQLVEFRRGSWEIGSLVRINDDLCSSSAFRVAAVGSYRIIITILDVFWTDACSCRKDLDRNCVSDVCYREYMLAEAVWTDAGVK